MRELKLNPGPGNDGGGILEHLHRAMGSTLRVLDLHGIGLGDRGGAKLFETLQAGQCAMLTSLKLGGNKLADHAIGMLMVEVLRAEACPLTALDLSDNGLSGTVLARAIKVNKSLTSLDIRGNPIDDQGLWVIGGLLLDDECECKLSQIRTEAFTIEHGMGQLDMRGSALDAGAARLLFGVLKFNGSLASLNLAATAVDHTSLNDLATALRHNTAKIRAWL